MLGQAIDLSKEPRKPTPQEQQIWKEFLTKFNELTDTYYAYMATSKVADAFQRWSNEHGVPFVVYDHIDQAAWDNIFKRYNIMSRLVDGCLEQKYFTHFSGGDVTILAPKTMPAEEYMNDIYPQTREESLKGILVLAIVAGVALLAGGLAGLAVADWDIRLRDRKFRDRILKADHDMLSKPKALRDEWSKMKRDSSQLIRKANDQHEQSWFEKLTSGATGVGVSLGIAAFAAAVFVVIARSRKG